MNLHITNETSLLKSVVLGQPSSLGNKPGLNETYDPASYQSVLKNIYPTQEAVYKEMKTFEEVLLKYEIRIFRPVVLKNYNQVFSRDVAFVIDDKIIQSNIIPEREEENSAYDMIFNQISSNQILTLPEKSHVEGGDVVLYDDIVFVGLYTGEDYNLLQTARTNLYAFDFLKEIFPEKTFIPLELIKHNTDPYKSVLHLDCAFMPVGRGKLIVFPDGFIKKEDYYTILDVFGKDNIFEITRDEMVAMNSNIFSISPKVVVSEQNFVRLNNHLENVWNLSVERIPYAEISKMGGLLRCSTLPLIRE